MERLLRNEHGLRKEGSSSLQTWRPRKFSLVRPLYIQRLTSIVRNRSGFTTTIFSSSLACFENFSRTRNPTSRSSSTVLSLLPSSSVVYLVRDRSRTNLRACADVLSLSRRSRSNSRRNARMQPRLLPNSLLRSSLLVVVRPSHGIRSSSRRCRRSRKYHSNRSLPDRYRRRQG